MGIIIRQSIKGTMFSYAGVLLGVVNILLLMPNILLPEEIGLINFLISMSAIFAEFSALGINQVTTRLFSYFRSKENHHNGYMSIALFTTSIGFLLAVIIFLLIRGRLVEDASDDSVLFSNYLYYLIPLIAATLYFNLFDNILKVLYNSTIGVFYKEVVFRLLVFINLSLVYLKVYNFEVFFNIYVITLMAPALVLFIELQRKKEFSVKIIKGFITGPLRKQMFKVAFYGMLSSVSGMVILNFDKYLITSSLDLKATGIYSIAFFMGSLILKPTTALFKISSVVLADSWKNNDLKNIFNIYKEGCLHLYLAGLFLLLGLTINLDNIFDILPPQYAGGKLVVFLIGLAYVIETVSGPGGMVILTSRYFPMLTYFGVFSGIVLVICGYVLIPIFGINGAALAVICSRLSFSAAKILFLLSKYGKHPFNKKFFLTTLIGLISYASVYYIPVVVNTYIDIIVRSSIYVVVFISILLALNISKTVEDIFKQVINYILQILKKK